MGLKSIIILVACACLVGGCVYILYDFNGGSLDLSDREVVLVVTDSMDGDVRGYAVDSFPADTLLMVEHVPDHEKRFLRVGEVITYHTEGGVGVASDPCELTVTEGDYNFTLNIKFKSPIRVEPGDFSGSNMDSRIQFILEKDTTTSEGSGETGSGTGDTGSGTDEDQQPSFEGS
jgi:hypothetical protein